jgi:uncharacterized membrane protein
MLLIVSIWVHVLAAMVWIGGMVFVSLVLVPSLRRIDDRDLRIDLLTRVARRFRIVAWASIVVLIVTGAANLALLGQWPSLETSFGRVLVIKLIAVGVMLALTGLHDVTASMNGGVPVGTVRWLPRAGLVLGLVVVLCAVFLARVGM